MFKTQVVVQTSFFPVKVILIIVFGYASVLFIVIILETL